MAIIPDPDFDGFDGIFVGSATDPPLPEVPVDYAALGRFMRETGKTYQDMTDEEKNRFVIEIQKKD